MIEEIKVGAVDESSRFVLKIFKTTQGEFNNRKLAISNFMYNCEQDRIKYDRPVFNSPVQTHHLIWDFLLSDWDYTRLIKSKEHAEKHNRLFLTYNQRSDKQMNDLKIDKSLNDFYKLVNIVDNVPFQLPLSMTLIEWKSLRPNLISSLKLGQNLVPIISSRHSTVSFPLIIKEEIGRTGCLTIQKRL